MDMMEPSTIGTASGTRPLEDWQRVKLRFVKFILDGGADHDLDVEIQAIYRFANVPPSFYGNGNKSWFQFSTISSTLPNHISSFTLSERQGCVLKVPVKDVDRATMYRVIEWLGVHNERKTLLGKNMYVSEDHNCFYAWRSRYFNLEPEERENLIRVSLS
jgi:hypothetical protein